MGVGVAVVLQTQADSHAETNPAANDSTYPTNTLFSMKRHIYAMKGILRYLVMPVVRIIGPTFAHWGDYAIGCADVLGSWVVGTQEQQQLVTLKILCRQSLG